MSYNYTDNNNLRNSELFEKTRHLPSICQHLLDQRISKRLEQRFVSGWYPVHDQIPSKWPAGIKSYKTHSFRNNRVVCCLCDQPPSNTAKEHCEGFGLFPSADMCVQKRREMPRCRSVAIEPAQREPVGQMANTWMRLHNPHFWGANTPKNMPWDNRTFLNGEQDALLRYSSIRQTPEVAKHQMLMEKAATLNQPKLCEKETLPNQLIHTNETC